MDGELLAQSPIENSDDNKGVEGDNRPKTPFSYSEVFESSFSYYLSIGMTYDQFWNDDCMLVKYYREAEEIRKERKNQELWLQGMYIYDAVIRISPILRAFAKKGTKPQPYPSEPYAINKKTAEDMEERKAKATQEKGLRFMEAIMEQNNKRFGGGGKDKCQT